MSPIPNHTRCCTFKIFQIKPFPNPRGFTRFFNIIVNIILAGGVGYAIGEVVSLAVNRKRGIGLAVIAGLALVLSYLVNIFTFGRLPAGLFSIGLDLVSVAVGIFLAANRLR